MSDRIVSARAITCSPGRNYVTVKVEPAQGLDFLLPSPLKIFGWLATFVMAIAAIGMFATWAG